MRYEQGELWELMKRRGISDDWRDRIIDSDYILMPNVHGFSSEEISCVADLAYGSKMHIGLTPVDEFFEDILRAEPSGPRAPTYKVSSLSNLLTILNTDRHRRYFEGGWMSFRGQTREYSMKRSCPNPHIRDEEGRERLIIPSFWRQFKDDWSRRFAVEKPTSLLSSILGHELIYYGLPSVSELTERNLARYGPHSLSDLEDFDDPESREYYRRWQLNKINADWEMPLVEQHYGIDTCGLDVTFDYKTALFFATNMFMTNSDEIAFYKPVQAGQHTGVLYAFVFRDPSITQTADMVRSIRIMDHVSPIRPIWQKCALPIFESWNFNEAATDLDAVFYLTPDFECDEMLTQDKLFPPEDEDPFYKAVLDLRERFPDLAQYRKFVKYRAPSSHI
jgi:hypothetical protein